MRAASRSPIDRLSRGEASIVTGLLDILAEAVTIRDRHGDIIYGNRAALATMRLSSSEELRGQDGSEIMARFSVEDEHGRPLGIDDLPGRKLLDGRDAEPLMMRVVELDTGEVIWRLLKSTELRDRRGRFVGAMTVIEDVTAVKTAELRTRVLAESGRILAGSLDYQETLRNVAQIAVPAVADYCGVDLLDEHGRLERVAAAHRDPAKYELAERLQTIERSVPEPGTPSGRVLLTGTSELYPDVSADELASFGRNQVHYDLIRELGVRSVLLVPMRVPNRTIGMLTLATDASARRLGHDDLELGEQLARRAAVAVENSRLHTKLAHVAETLQQSLLPRELPKIRDWELASLYLPADSEHRIDVGGDFYEFFEHEGVWFVIVGDVTGKGIMAASMTALMRHGARVAVRTEPHPAAILYRLDEALKQQAEPSLCTALCLAIYDDHVIISSAGHPPALLVTGDGGEVRQAPSPGPLLGAFADAEWSEQRVEVSPGQLLMLYTDGVTETAGDEDRFGTERLLRLVATHAADGPAALLARLESTLSAFRSGPERDDVAALALCKRS